MNKKIEQLADVVKLVILGTLSALLIYPLVLIIFPPVFVYRIVVNYLVKKWDPRVHEIISGLSAVLIGSDLYSKPDIVTIIGFALKTKVDRNQVIDVINKQILTSNEFSKLSKKLVRKFGYYFWYESDRIITATDHVHYLYPKCPEQPVTRRQILENESQALARRPFAADRSPWEILLVPNVYDERDPSNKSVVILRTHHCLMDGLSVRNFMKKAAVTPWKEDEAHQTRPYHTLRQALFNNDTSEFMKMVFLDQQKMKDQQFLKCKELERRISLDKLKTISKFYKANISSILATLVMEATARFIRKRWGNVEKNMYLQMAYPIPGHPGKMTNHWTTIRVPIVFHENDPVESLKRNIKKFEKISNSTIPTLNFYLSNLLGMLPVYLIPKSEDISRQVIVLTNVLGTMGREDLFGYVYDDIILQAAMRNGTAFAYGCVSAGGKLGVHFGANPSLFKTSADAEDINESMEDTLRILEASVK